MKIKYQFMISFLVIVAIFLLAGILINLNIMQIERANNEVVKSVDLEELATNYETGARNLQIGVYLYVHENKELGRQLINDGSDKMKTSRTSLKSSLEDPEMLSDLSEVERFEETVIEASNDVVTVADKKESTALLEQRLRTLQGRVEAMNLKLSSFMEATRARMDASVEQSKEYGEMTKNMTYAASILSLIVSVLVAFFMAGHLTKPLISLTETANKVSKGDIQEKIAISSKDEIGDLAESFKRMINAFKVMDALSKEKE